MRTAVCERSLYTGENADSSLKIIYNMFIFSASISTTTVITSLKKLKSRISNVRFNENPSYIFEGTDSIKGMKNKLFIIKYRTRAHSFVCRQTRLSRTKQQTITRLPGMK